MKLCGDDCFEACANCRHWTGDRVFDGNGRCLMKDAQTDDMDSCDDFHCVHATEVTTND